MEYIVYKEVIHQYYATVEAKDSKEAEQKAWELPTGTFKYSGIKDESLCAYRTEKSALEQS